MAEAASTPHIIVDEGLSGGIAARIEFIDNRMHIKPDQFLTALDLVGGTAVAQTRDIADKREAVHNVPQRPADLIIEYFRERYDRQLAYDDATEEAIAADPTHKALLASLGKHGNHVVRRGVMSTVIRTDPEAIDVRDQLRLSRLGLYLGHISAAKQAVA